MGELDQNIAGMTGRIHNMSVDMRQMGHSMATMTNAVVKRGMAIWLGAPSMRRTMIPTTVALAASGLAAAFLAD